MSEQPTSPPPLIVGRVAAEYVAAVLEGMKLSKRHFLHQHYKRRLNRKFKRKARIVSRRSA